MKKLFVWIVSLIILFNGYANSNESEDNLPIFMKEEGVLKVDGYVVSSKGLDYTPHLSPNQQFIVVETRVMSDIQIIELFSRGRNGKFKLTHHSLSQEIWEKHLKDKPYSIEEIEFAKIGFDRWVNNHSFYVTLSYQMNFEEIKDTVLYYF